MKKEWEVNHIGSEKICPTCGRSMGFSGSSLSEQELRIISAIMGEGEAPAIEKQEKLQEPTPPPPCGDMGVWEDREDDVQC